MIFLHSTMEISMTAILSLSGIIFSHCMASATYQNSECALEITEHGMSLLNKGIELIDRNIKIKGRFHEALLDLYQNIDRTHIIDITKIYLRNITIEADGKTYSAEKTFDMKKVFEKRYIYLYTTLAVYKRLNQILRDHDCSSKSLTHEDLYYAPYSAVLMSVLMFWSNLNDYKGLTYRGANLPESDINQYFPGKRFVWTQFISTSRADSMAFERNVNFVIHNDNFSPYMGPKPVYLYAWKPELDEAIYIPGAEFQVLNISRSVGRVKITLKTIEISSDGSSGIYMSSLIILLLITFCVLSTHFLF